MFSPDFSVPVWNAGPNRRSYRSDGTSAEVDLGIIGGGITGLTAALHAARRGLSVHLVEARRIGEGASGLNGGQVIPGLKFDPEALRQRFGEEAGETLTQFVEATADTVFGLIEAERLDVPHRRSGWIQACHTETALAAARERHRQWAARGADVALLDGARIRALVGTDNYLGGFLDRRAGAINPLAFVTELARVASAAGAVISENRACERLERRDGAWRVTTPSGDIRARSVILATNAYSGDLIPGLARSLVPLHSFQIATAPLPDQVGRSILPQGQAVSDSRRILVYYRRTEDGRLILGGRGRMAVPKNASDWAHLERAMLRLFPALAGVAVEKRWFGRVAMTPDHLPHLHEPEKGLVTLVGCQGRGVGLMTAIGPRLVDYLHTGDASILPFPVTPIRPIPLHGFRQLGVAATIAWYRMRDAAER